MSVCLSSRKNPRDRVKPDPRGPSVGQWIDLGKAVNAKIVLNTDIGEGGMLVLEVDRVVDYFWIVDIS